MSKTKMIYDKDGTVYAVGTSKDCNKLYDRIVRAYPNKKMFMSDAENQKKTDCVGAKRSVQFVPIQK